MRTATFGSATALAVLVIGACAAPSPPSPTAATPSHWAVTPSATPSPTPVHEAGGRIQSDIARVLKGDMPLYPADAVEATGESAHVSDELAFGAAVAKAAPMLEKSPLRDLSGIGYRSCDLLYLAEADVAAAVDAVTAESSALRSSIAVLMIEVASQTLCPQFEPDFDDWLADSYADWKASL